MAALFRLTYIIPILCCAGIDAFEDLDFRKPQTIADRRVNLCKQRDAIHNTHIKMENALRGLHITAVACDHHDQWFEERADGTQTGFHVELMREVALSAGFTYTIVAVPESSFRPDLNCIRNSSIAPRRSSTSTSTGAPSCCISVPDAFWHQSSG